MNSLNEFAVPLDQGAVAQLQNSSLALDVYTWLAHRRCLIHRPSGTRVSWMALRLQFGDEYAKARDFKRELLKALRRVIEVYPDARVEIVGLSQPAEQPVKPVPTRKAARISKYVSEDALDRLRTIAPGWDRQYLLARFLKFIADKDQPSDFDAAFQAWVKSFTKGKSAA